jgi:histidyl-tRNA synthetase
MSKVSTNPPSGFRDFLPHEAAARLELIETITRVYRAHGYQTIGLPFLENLSTLQGKGGGGENEKLIFKILQRGEALTRALEAGSELADLGLRFDLTLPLARYCAKYREQLPKPFKVFQIGPVWRADRPQKGRFREFFQCDVDIIGAKEIGAEVDVISAILEVFDAVGMGGIEVHLNDRRLLSALGKSFGLSDVTWSKVMVSLDKLDKVEADKVFAEIQNTIATEVDGANAVVNKLRAAFTPSGNTDSVWDTLDAEAFSSVQKVMAYLEASGARAALKFNPTMIRGQDYYTGTIFEIRHPSLSGSLGGGGRYNRLMEVFGAPETPAFGGSIGFERLAMLLEEQKRFAAQAGGPQVFFPLFGDDVRGAIVQLASELRAGGLRVDVFPDAGVKFGKQLSYAEDRQIPFAIILGGDELARRQVKVKNMTARSEEIVAFDSLSQHMVKLCKS